MVTGRRRAVLLRDPRNTALITGSISGTGLAIALRLARSGGAVTPVYASGSNRAAPQARW